VRCGSAMKPDAHSSALADGVEKLAGWSFII